MRVIDSPEKKSVLGDLFANYADVDFTVINLERQDDMRGRSKIPGLDDALKIADEGKPVVMLGFIEFHRHDMRWHAAMGYPNVAFCRLPATREDAAKALAIAQAATRAPDLLARLLVEADIQQSEISSLNHSLSHIEDSDEFAFMMWERSACKIFGFYDRGTLISMVKNAMEHGCQPCQFKGISFDDVCVDVEDTLFTSEWELREDVARLVKDFASTGSIITVWTGGDLKKAGEALDKAGLPYKLVPKSLMRGARVGYIIDNLPYAEFQATYEIGCMGYRQV